MPAAGIVLGVLSVLSLVGTVYLSVTHSSRYMKRCVVPLLVRSLAPLQPTEAELRSAIEELRDRRLLAGRKLRPEWVIEAIGLSATMTAHDQLAPR